LFFGKNVGKTWQGSWLCRF